MTKSLQEIQQENLRLILEATKLPQSLLNPPQDLAKETFDRIQRQINKLLNNEQH